jgi:hypothetical protein
VRSPGRRTHIIAAVVVVAGLVAAGAAIAQSRGGERRTPAPAGLDQYAPAASPPVADQTVASLVPAVLKLADGSFVRAIQVGAPPSRPDSNPTWAYISVASPSADDEALAMWQADIVAGVLADGGPSQNQSNNLAGYNIIETHPNRTSSGQQRGVGAVVRGQVFSSKGARSDLEIRLEIEQKLAPFDLRVVDFSVVRVGSGAPAVTVRTGDRVAAAKRFNAAIRAALFSESGDPLYEGYFFELVDSHGSMVSMNHASFRTGVGGLSIAPDVESVTDATHGDLPRRVARSRSAR